MDAFNKLLATLEAALRLSDVNIKSSPINNNNPDDYFPTHPIEIYNILYGNQIAKVVLECAIDAAKQLKNLGLLSLESNEENNKIILTANGLIRQLLEFGANDAGKNVYESPLSHSNSFLQLLSCFIPGMPDIGWVSGCMGVGGYNSSIVT